MGTTQEDRQGRTHVIRLTNVERGEVRTLYVAVIEVDGRYGGYVQRERGDVYRAYSGGRLVARAQTLQELRGDLAEHFANEPEADDEG